MSKFKISDWVKHTGCDKFYEVINISDSSLCLRITYEKGVESTDVWYPIELYFIKKEETMKLEVGGKYRMVGTHEPVRVICTDRKSSGTSKDFTCVSLVCNNEFEYTFLTTLEGKDILGEILFEKVPEVDWSKIPVDTPIWVGKEPRHFAGFSSHTEEVFYYSSGTTSHTSQKVCNGLRTQFSTHKSNCSLEKG